MAASANRAGIAVRGTLIALAVAGVIGAVVFAGVILISGNADDALRAGAYVAAPYLAINLAVLGVGLLAKPSAGWAVGSALATPLIVAAIGFGYTIFVAKPL